MNPAKLGTALLLLALSAVPAQAGAGRWTPFGPGSNHVTEVFLAPRIAPGDAATLYAVSDGEVFRSVDGGSSWVWASFGLVTPPGSEITALTADLENPLRLYAGSLNDNDLFRSDDGGRTWSKLPNPPSIEGTYALAAVNGTVYQGGLDGLFVSHDGGASWSHWQEDFAVDISVSRAAPETVFVSGYSRIWRSTDGGDTFSEVYHETVNFPEFAAVAVSPTDPARAYTAARYNILSSTDGGDTWETRSYLEKVGALAVDAGSPSRVYAAHPRGVSVSTDGGATWTTTLEGRAYSVVADPDRPGAVYAGLPFRGFFVSRDGGLTWSSSARGLGFPPVALLERDPEHPETWYVCRVTCFRSRDDGRTWTPFPSNRATDPRLSDMAFDPSEPDVVYAAGQGIFRIEDDGANWVGLPLGAQRSRTLTSVVANRGVILAGGAEGAFRSSNRGATWKVVLPKVVDAGSPGSTADDINRQVLRFVEDPADPRTVYALTREQRTGAPAVDRYVILRTRDGGVSWRRILAGSKVLALDPDRPSTLYAVRDGGVLRSGDRGLKWTRVGTLPFADVRDLAMSSDALVAGTQAHGVFRSLDNGRTWAAFNTGLARIGIINLQRVIADPVTPNRFFVLPGRGGIFEATIP